MMKRKNAVLLVLILLAAIGFLAYRRIQDRRTPPRAGRSRPVPVETAPVRSGTLVDEGMFRGTLIARSQFILAPKVSGRLRKLAVDIGDEVRRGDLVAVLDGDEYAQQVAQAQAELDVSRAALEDAESALAVAASDLGRVRELHRERVASDSDLEEAEARKRAADAQVKLAQARIRQREAFCRSAEVRLSYTLLHAEWEEGRGDTWLVAERFADEGSMLRANDPVVSVVDAGMLLAVVHAIESDFPAVEPGQTALLRTDAYPGEEFKGIVVRRAPVLNERSRHARVEVEVENRDGRLAPGMFVRVRIRFGVRENAVVIPVSALTRRDGRRGVFLVDTDETIARFVTVETGIQSNDLVEILDPELAGDVVILGHHLLEDGGAVLLQSGDGAEPERPGNRNALKDAGGGRS